MEFRSRIHSGMIVNFHTSDFNYKGCSHHATKDDLQFQIRSDKTRSCCVTQKEIPDRFVFHINNPDNREIDFSNELADELKNLITASMGLEKCTA